MLDPKLRQRRAELLILHPQPRHFANQIAHHADQIGRRQAFKRIRRRRSHPQLESHFSDFDSPCRPEICPGYRSVSSQFLFHLRPKRRFFGSN